MQFYIIKNNILVTIYTSSKERDKKMSIREKNLEKVILQCQKTLDKIEEELSKPELKLTPYDI